MTLSLLAVLLLANPLSSGAPTEGETIGSYVLPGDSLAEAAEDEGTSAASAWESTLLYNYQYLSENRSPWTTVRFLLKREDVRGAMVFDGARITRFGLTDLSLGLSAWPNLGERRYGHFRLEYAPDADVLPGLTTGARLYQAVGAWEISSGYELNTVEAAPVHRFTAGVARYVGSWYLRTRTTLLPRDGELGVVQRLRARYYLEPPSEYIDFTAGMGKLAAVVESGPVVQLVPTYFLTGRVQRFVTSDLGFSLLASYTDETFFTRLGFLGGILTRW